MFSPLETFPEFLGLRVFCILLCLSVSAKRDRARPSESKQDRDSEDVVSIYNGLLVGSEKGWHPAICSNVDVAGGGYAKRNTSVRERPISYDVAHVWKF